LVGVKRLGQVDQVTAEFARVHSDRLWKHLVLDSEQKGGRRPFVAMLLFAAIAAACVVHLIRNAMRFVASDSMKPVAAALKPIYQAANADRARVELDAFAGSPLGQKNPHAAKVFENAWERFICHKETTDSASRR
jgi:hypothetical protein